MAQPTYPEWRHDDLRPYRRCYVCGEAAVRAKEVGPFVPWQDDPYSVPVYCGNHAFDMSVWVCEICNMPIPTHLRMSCFTCCTGDDVDARAQRLGREGNDWLASVGVHMRPPPQVVAMQPDEADAVMGVGCVGRMNAEGTSARVMLRVNDPGFSTSDPFVRATYIHECIHVYLYRARSQQPVSAALRPFEEGLCHAVSIVNLDSYPYDRFFTPLIERARRTILRDGGHEPRTLAALDAIRRASVRQVVDRFAATGTYR